MEDLDALEDQMRALEQRLAEARAYEKQIGPLFTAASKFHDIKCTANHTDGCGWYYEHDSTFIDPRTTRGRWVKEYQEKKEKMEAIVQHPLSHDQFLAMARVI